MVSVFPLVTLAEDDGADFIVLVDTFFSTIGLACSALLLFRVRVRVGVRIFILFKTTSP